MSPPEKRRKSKKAPKNRERGPDSGAAERLFSWVVDSGSSLCRAVFGSEKGRRMWKREYLVNVLVACIIGKTLAYMFGMLMAVVKWVMQIVLGAAVFFVLFDIILRILEGGFEL